MCLPKNAKNICVFSFHVHSSLIIDSPAVGSLEQLAARRGLLLVSSRGVEKSIWKKIEVIREPNIKPALLFLLVIVFASVYVTKGGLD